MWLAKRTQQALAKRTQQALAKRTQQALAKRTQQALAKRTQRMIAVSRARDSRTSAPSLLWRNQLIAADIVSQPLRPGHSEDVGRYIQQRDTSIDRRRAGFQGVVEV